MANFRDLILDTTSSHGDCTAFTLKTGKDQVRDITYHEFYDEIRAVGTSMIRSGIAGRRVAIIGINCYEWFLAHTAALLSGCVSAPLDKGLKIDELEQSLIRAEIKHVFYCRDQKENIEKIMAEGRTDVISAIPLFDDEKPGISGLLKEGRFLVEEGDTSMDHVKIDDYAMSIMLFTSGTTSQSKVVMLSQNNIVSNAYRTLSVEPVYENDTNLALLPYHHVMGSIAQWVLLLAGGRTVYCDGLKHIQKNMIEYGVTIFVGVPLIVESMYKRVMHQAEKKGIAKKVKMLSKVGSALNKVGIDVRRKIFKSVIDAFGGRLRMCIIGGAAGDIDCINGFQSFGILTMQGYGLTETSPILTAERPKHQHAGSVGIPIPGVEIRIDNPDENGIGEIVARGEGIMLGYYGNQEATDEVIVDGWFHTGDLGKIDKKGFVFITGRKKNVIVLKNGKNVFPEELEQLIAPLPYVNEAVVLGVPEPDDERDLVVTLKLVYNKEVLPDMTFEEIYEKVKKDIELINDKTPSYKRIRRIIVTDREMVKTTTGKVKRFVEIESIINERKKQGK